MKTKVIKDKSDDEALRETEPKEQKLITKTDFPIVGIGASAGGLEALEQFFTNVPKNCGIAFVVIQHLDPTSVVIH